MSKFNVSIISELDFYILDASFNAGTRDAGRVISGTLCGRKIHGLLYLYSGAIVFIDKDENIIHSAAAGDLVYIPIGASYKLKYVEETRFSLMNFNTSSSDGKTVLLNDGIVNFAERNFDANIVTLFDKAEKLRFYDGGGSVFKKKALIYRLLGYLCDPHYKRDSKSERIIPAIEMLENRYLENFEVGELANACYMSVSNFRKLFVASFGVSPIQYRNRLRLKHAEILLEEGCHTVSEIALLSGFLSESYFCRLYKKMMGRTPTSFESPD